MSGVLIHDGRRPGQKAWTVAAVKLGCASGTILTPFSTPRVAEPRHPNAKHVAEEVRTAGGEVFFDVMTHARLLPGTDRTDFYDQWELWGPSGVGLDSAKRRLEHVERVFERQDQLSVPHLTPTQSLSSPVSADARAVLATARLALGLDSTAAQSLAGTREFWSSEANLDTFVGTLASLRAPVWVLTMVNDVVDSAPDMVDTKAFAGFARTVRSLSLRSRMIVAHGDYTALPAIAAGADTVGTGWDRGQRTFDPLTYHVASDDGIRRPASYVTQGGMQAILRRSIAEALERWDPTKAHVMRGGAMPKSDQEQREHHFTQLQAAVQDIDGAGTPGLRVGVLRQKYLDADGYVADVIANVPGVLRLSDARTWVDYPSAALEEYAAAEGL